MAETDVAPKQDIAQEQQKSEANEKPSEVNSSAPKRRSTRTPKKTHKFEQDFDMLYPDHDMCDDLPTSDLDDNEDISYFHLKTNTSCTKG